MTNRDDLEQELAELSAHIEAATHRQLELLRELETSGIWIDHGATSFAAWLGWRIGLAPGAAREKIRVARALASLPAIDAAFAAARISYSKVRALTRVASSSNEVLLLGYALHTTAAQLEKICRGLRRVDRDVAPERWVRQRAMDDGMVRIEASLHADEAALVWKAIEIARGLGSRGAPIASADALVRIADAFLGGDAEGRGGERAQIVVHLEAVGETITAQLDDGTHVPAETLRRISCDASLVKSDGSRSRVVPPRTRRALLSRDRACRLPGCEHRAWLDAHHVEHWAHGGPTELENLVLLCPAHHRLVHEGGFSVELRQGEPIFRSPSGVELELAPVLPVGAMSFSLLRRHVSAETSLDASTLLPWWDGDIPDYAACVETARAATSPS